MSKRPDQRPDGRKAGVPAATERSTQSAAAPRSGQAAAGPVTLQRALRLHQAVALGVGGTIGGGIFVLVGEAAGLAGPGALLAFVLAFAAAGLIALPYAELACRYPLAGGGYAFAREVLGPRWGFLMGWGFWGAYLFVSGYVTLGFGGYLHALTGVPTVAGAVALVAVCTAVNLAGVRLSGRAQTAVVVLAVAALVAFGLFGLRGVDPDRFTPFLPQGLTGVGLAALVAFLAFGGFDMVAAAGEEITEPQRNLPRAILLTLALVLGVYLLVVTVAIGVLSGEALARSPAPLADAAAAALGGEARRLVAVAALLTTAGTANAVLVVTSRISFAMARDGLLPRALARVHPSTRAPWAATTLSGAILAAVAVWGSVGFASSVGGFLYVVHFAFPLAALVILRRAESQSPSRAGIAAPEPGFRTPLPRVVLPLAGLACVGLLIASGTTGMVGGLAWLAAGAAADALRRGR